MHHDRNLHDIRKAAAFLFTGRPASRDPARILSLPGLAMPFFPWYNDCAQRNPARSYRAAPLRGDYTLALRLAEKMPPPAALSPLRPQYNDCAQRNPARSHRAAPLRGDYTLVLRLAEKMPPPAALSPLRPQYNDCAQRNPALFSRAAPLPPPIIRNNHRGNHERESTENP